VADEKVNAEERNRKLAWTKEAK